MSPLFTIRHEVYIHNDSSDETLTQLVDQVHLLEGAISQLTQQQGTLMTVFTDLDAAITTYISGRDAADAAKDTAIADGLQKLKDALAAVTADQTTIDTLNAHVADLEQQIADATTQAQADIAKLAPPAVTPAP